MPFVVLQNGFEELTTSQGDAQCLKECKTHTAHSVHFLSQPCKRIQQNNLSTVCACSSSVIKEAD